MGGMLLTKSVKSLSTSAAAVAASLFLASCSAGGTTPAGTPAAGDGSETPTQASADTVVASTTVWADVAGAVLDKEIPAVISNPATDPHEFEPSAADLAKVKEAALLVANGGTYDHAIYSAADPSNVISALPLTDHGHEHDHAEAPEGATEDPAEHNHEHEENEHIWYDTQVVREVADKLAAAAAGNDSKADTSSVNQRLEDVDTKLATLPAARVAQTHPIADAIVDNTALEEVTPEDYRRATLNETEPSSAAVAELVTKIENGEVDLLIDNPQTPSALTDRILAAAKEHNVPVVDIAETPQDGENFFDYFDTIAGALTDALAKRQ